MGGWKGIYQDLARSMGFADQKRIKEGTAWLEPLWPLLGEPTGRSLDLGCGMGADMLRYAERGWRPFGLEREVIAAEAAHRHWGFPIVVGDLTSPLPFGDEQFTLLTARCSLHFVPPARTPSLYGELHRLLRPGGRLLFIVNSDEHRRHGLQYDYTGAVEQEPGFWHIPSIGRSYYFYTPDLARNFLAEGWEILHLAEHPFSQWGIDKIVLSCVARRC